MLIVPLVPFQVWKPGCSPHSNLASVEWCSFLHLAWKKPRINKHKKGALRNSGAPTTSTGCNGTFRKPSWCSVQLQSNPKF